MPACSSSRPYARLISRMLPAASIPTPREAPARAASRSHNQAGGPGPGGWPRVGVDSDRVEALGPGEVLTLGSAPRGTTRGRAPRKASSRITMTTVRNYSRRGPLSPLNGSNGWPLHDVHGTPPTGRLVTSLSQAGAMTPARNSSRHGSPRH